MKQHIVHMTENEPNFVGPMDTYTNKINLEEALKVGKGKSFDLNNIVRKERILTVHKFISRWAKESDSFKLMLEVIGQFGTELPCPTIYALSDPLLKHEYVESYIQQVAPKNVVQVVTHNAMNDIGTPKLLKEKRPSIFWTSCSTHSIYHILEFLKCLIVYYNLLFNPLLRFKKVLDQAKKQTIFIYAHHKTLAMIRSYTNKEEIIQPRVTRFASAFLTLQGLSEKNEQLKHMFSITEWEECKFSGKPKGITSYKIVTSVQFMPSVTQCLKVFSPLVKVL
uniref:DUF659 domain-containing protein n=1 Tax=Lactuca sativa TaxID=4236 RepID=A0A9R1W942_LACSA|nr:hypothetical protein LSAT_V11C300135740 [Lactuca sativa]